MGRGQLGGRAARHLRRSVGRPRAPESWRARPGAGPVGGVPRGVNLRSRYSGLYTSDGGFYDAVNPVSGSVGHRRLVLDEPMIVAGLDDALDGGALQRYFERDPFSRAAKLYLSDERMSIG